MVRGTGKKGITPVIAVLLLVALTIAAVGMVAVILGTVTGGGPGKNVVLSTKGVYRPGYGDTGDNNTCDVKLTSWGPDTITEGDISISFEGSCYDAGVYTEWVRGSVEKVTASAKTATMQAGATADITVVMWPSTVGSGTAISIVFTRPGANNYIEVTSITVTDATSGAVLYQDADLPTPSTPPAPSPADFTISVSPTSDTIPTGGSDNATVTVTSIGGYAETVTLSASGQPSGVEVSFSENSGTPPFSSIMTINVDASVPVDSYSITITGTGADAKVHSCTYSLTVTTSVKVSGRQILVNGSPFSIKGVGYSPVPIGWASYDFYNDPDIYQRDFPLLRAMGCNTIRTWGEVTSTAFLDAAYNQGSNPIYVIMGFWIEGTLDLSDPAVRSNYINGFKTYVETYKDHPAVLMWCVGNEINMLFLDNDEKLRAWYTLLDNLAEAAHEVEGSTYHPVATANYELYQIGESVVSADDASMEYLDAWGSNAYFGLSFGTLFSDYASKSSKPFFITEYGIDAWDQVNGTEYENTQAEYAGALWDEMVANSDIVSGGTIMAYSDEWWKDQAGELNTHDYGGYSIATHPDGFSNEEWWGIMRTIDNGSGPDIMEPRQAYYTLLAKWGGSPPLDFTISVNPTSGSIPPGSSDTATVSVTSVGGYTETVTLSASGQPSGVTVGFSPSSSAPSFTSTMTVSVGASVSAGIYNITITGTGADGKVHSCTYALTVTTGAADLLIYSDAGWGSGLLACDWSDGGQGTFDWEYTGETPPEGSKCCETETNAGTWAGWGLLYRTEAWELIPTDLSAYAGGDLKFWVKTPVNLKVEMEGPEGTKSTKYIGAYGWDGTNTWQEITIPINDFTEADLSTMIYPFMATIETSGTFYVDNVRWTTV